MPQGLWPYLLLPPSLTRAKEPTQLTQVGLSAWSRIYVCTYIYAAKGSTITPTATHFNKNIKIKIVENTIP